jgi:hypothetical protein
MKVLDQSKKQNFKAGLDQGKLLKGCPKKRYAEKD